MSQIGLPHSTVDVLINLLILFSGIMDQDYECRLLRQINIQNENASPIVSKENSLLLLAPCLYTYRSHISFKTITSYKESTTLPRLTTFSVIIFTLCLVLLLMVVFMLFSDLNRLFFVFCLKNLKCKMH